MAIALLGRRNKEVNKVVLLPLEEIQGNPHQPRKYFEAEALQELSRSIIANGLLQPITVRKVGNGYELIAGERRTMAFRSLGRKFIPAIVEDYSDQQSAVLALIENLQRKDLNYFEEALGIARLMEQLNLTQQQVSVRIGKAQSTVANKLRLLRYSPQLQQTMMEAGLTERHARALLKIKEDDKLQSAVAHIIEKSFNVEQTEEYIEKLMMEKEHKIRTRLFVVKDVRIFQNSINKAVTMMNLAGIPASSVKTETDEFVEYTIQIPKSLAYKEKQYKQDSKQTRLESI